MLRIHLFLPASRDPAGEERIKMREIIPKKYILKKIKKSGMREGVMKQAMGLGERGGEKYGNRENKDVCLCVCGGEEWGEGGG